MKLQNPNLSIPILPQKRKKVVYFVRHAEALHNIKEREAVERAIANGYKEKEEQETARRAVLQDESLTDAPLSTAGHCQVQRAFDRLNALTTNNVQQRYPTPELVLVSPLRRALMTATDLFYNCNPRPRFVAMEALREKRTGYAADERSSIEILEAEFPHVDFSDLKQRCPLEVSKGEDNIRVRKRARDFLEGPMASIEENSVALVTHKGWLRELRGTLKDEENTGNLQVDFDLDCWDQTLYKNAEVRVAEFFWEGRHLVSLVSRSIESAIHAVTHAITPTKTPPNSPTTPLPQAICINE